MTATSSPDALNVPHASARPGHRVTPSPRDDSGMAMPHSEVVASKQESDETATIVTHDDIVLRRAVVVLATLASLSAVYAAKAILLPLSFVALLGCALRPVVARLRKAGIPAWASASAGSISVFAFLLLLVAPIVGQVQTLELSEPYVLRRHASTLRERLAPLQHSVDEIQSAASEIEEEISEDEAVEAEASVVVEKQRPLHYALGTSTAFLGQLLIVAVGLFFVLVSGNAVVEKTVAMCPRVSDQRRVVQLVQELEKGISAYLLTVTAINIGLGVCVGIAMAAWGVPGAMIIGFMACLLNFIPILGALIGVVIVGALSVLVFPPDQWTFWVGVPATYLALTSIEANLVTPSLLGRSMSLNPLAVFLALVFWGWMWGVGGIVVAVPLLAAMTIIAKHWDTTRPLAALLSSGDTR